MSSACVRRGSRILKKRGDAKSQLTERTLLFGQYVEMRGLKNDVDWEPVYMLLSTKDLSVSASREDQAYPIEVIKFQDIVGIVNPQLTDRHRHRRSSTIESLFRRDSFENVEGEIPQVKEPGLDYIGREETTFAVLTDPMGYFSGRALFFRTADQFYRDLWVAYFSLACSSEFEANSGPKISRWAKFVRRLRLIYTGKRAQSFVGALVRPQHI